ncbi:MAG TPA: glycine cleavage T C-terminal barrel domain-containing protein [Anaerolineae bacterium]|nr:glycine cleavage T C-terminal barrel domain-containing protein [Anaerolineae bacterium]
MPAEVGMIEREYAAAQTGSVLIDAAAWGRLKFTGKNRVDFLQRLSTNDLLSLQAGQGAGTVFTTPIARIIDRTVAYVRQADVLMLTSRGNQARVLQWLRKYIFFNDDVQIEDVTEKTGMLSVYGALANQIVARLTGADLAALPLHHWRAVPVAEVEVMIARADPIAHGGFHLIFEKGAQANVWQALQEAGAVPSSEATYQILRVEAGRPEFGHELGDEYIPLEANLWNDVSFKKGCYTGQEIIARMESRQKLAKRLVGLRFEGAMALPATLWLAEQEVGVVTSVVHSPALGWIGLGYLKSSGGAEAQVVQSRSGERMVQTMVSALPFKSG